GELLGLDKDFSTLKKHDKDGFEIELTSVLNKYLGKEFRHLVTAFFEDINEKSVCKVEVKPSPKPVYLRRDKGSEFYIRAGNSSQPLDMEEANEYISMHWKK
ncbi:MAG: ATP-binding protein, partial [Proteobacteria bacterium]|nr:ATP-binding protein [Pseudomonadota bacterium]